MRQLKTAAPLRHPLLVEVRSAGMSFAAEFVKEDGTTPASDFVADLVEAMVARGFLMNRIGRHGPCLKIRPPMPFSVENADSLLDNLEDTLLTLQVPA